jgi:hypothetical protein
MNYSIIILEIELKRLNKIYNSFDFTSTSAIIDFEIINKIKDMKDAIALIYREMAIKITSI